MIIIDYVDNPKRNSKVGILGLKQSMTDFLNWNLRLRARWDRKDI